MGKGFFSGIIAGLLVSFGFFLVLSTTAPMKAPSTPSEETVVIVEEPVKEPAPVVVEQPTPAAEQVAEPAPEVDPAPAPEVVDVRPAPATTPVPQQPDAPTGDAAVVSNVELPSGSGFGGTSPDVPANIPQGEGSESLPLADTQSAALPNVSDNVIQSQGGGEATTPGLPEPVLQADPVLPSPAIPAPKGPVTEAPPSMPLVNLNDQSSGDGIIRKAVPGLEISKPDVAVNRLPNIADAPATADASPAEKVAALIANAQPFAPVPGKPLVALVLRDIGGGGVDVSAWKDLGIPVTVILDPARPDAATTAEAYRDAGFEVVLTVGGLPVGATASDLEVSLSKYLSDVPVAVALMPEFSDPRPFPAALLQHLMAIASDSGHGVLTGGSGLAGRGAQVAQVAIDRVIDAQNEDAATQHRLMDRTVFDAAQNRTAVVFAHTYPWTYVSLLEWVGKNRDGSAQMAPLSAVLNARN